MAGDLNVRVNLEARDAELQKALNDWQRGLEGGAAKLNKLLGGNEKFVKELQIKVDDKGVQQFEVSTRKVLTGIEQIEREAKKLNKVEIGSVTNIRQSLNNARQLRDSIQVLGTTIDKVSGKPIIKPVATAGFLQANERVRQLTEQLRLVEQVGQTPFQRIGQAARNSGLIQFGRGVQDLVGIFQSLSIATSAIVRPLTQAGTALAKLQGFSLTFKSIGVDAGQANQVLQDSARIALGLGTNIDTVRQGYAKLSPVILATGGSLDDVSKVLENLTSRFAAFGLGADQSRRVLNGVIQAFAKGKLQAEELTQQISEADPAFKVDFVNALNASSKALKLLGVETIESIGQLEELVKAGKIIPEVFVEGLKGIGKVDLLFGKLGDSAKSAFEAVAAGEVTITQFRENLNTLNQLSFENLAKTFKPVLISLFEIQSVLTDFVSRIASSGALQSIGKLFGDIGSAIAGTTETFLRITEVVVGFIGNITTLVQKVTSFISPITSLGGVLDELGTPLEFIATFLGVKLIAGIVKATASFVKFSSEATKAANSIVTAFNRSEKEDVIGKDVGPRVKSTTARLSELTKQTGAATTATKALDSATQGLIQTQAKFKASEVAKPLIPDPFDPDERGTSIVKFDANFAEAQKGLENLQNRTDDLAKGFKNAETNANILAGQKFKAPTIAVQKLATTTTGLGPRFKAIQTIAATSFTRIAGVTSAASAKILALGKNVLTTVKSFAVANASLIGLTAAFIAIGKVQEAFSARNERIKESVEPIDNAIENLQETLKDSEVDFSSFGEEAPSDFDKARTAAQQLGRDISGLDVILGRVARTLKAIDFAGVFTDAGDDIDRAGTSFTTFKDKAQGALIGAVIGAGAAKLAVGGIAAALVKAGLAASATGVGIKIGLGLIAAGALIGALSIGKLSEALDQVQDKNVETTKAIRAQREALVQSSNAIQENIVKFLELEKQVAETTDKDLKLKLQTELIIEKEKLNQQVKALKLAAVELEVQLNLIKARRQVQQDLLSIAQAVQNSRLAENTRSAVARGISGIKTDIANIFKNLDPSALETLRIQLGSLGDNIKFENIDAFKQSLEDLPDEQVKKIAEAFLEIAGNEDKLREDLKELDTELKVLEATIGKVVERADELSKLLVDPDIEKANKELADFKESLRILKRELEELNVNPELPKSLEALQRIVDGIAEAEAVIRIQADIKNAELALANLRKLGEEVRAGLETPIRIQLQIANTQQFLDTVSITQGGQAEAARQFYQDIQFRAGTAYQTIGQLQQQLYQNQIQQIQLVAQADAQRSQRAISALDREIAAAQRYWNKRLKQVQEYVGPATRELQRLREEELRQQAREPGRDGLEARAQLEAIAKEKELAAIRRQAEKEIAELREKRFKLEERARQRQEAFQNKITKIQEKSNALQAQALERQEAILLEIIGKRKASGEEAVTTSRELLKGQTELKAKIDEANVSREQTTQELEDQKNTATELAAEVAKIDEGLESSLQNVVNQIDVALDGVGAKLDSIFQNKSYTINVKLNVTGGEKKAGGPVLGGVPYTVNEAGQEAFLSSSGKITPIRKPAFGTFTPKEDGMIIPHHIWQDVQGSAKPSVSPRAKPNVRTGNMPASRQKDRSAQILAAAMSAMNQTNRVTRNAAKDSSAAQIKQLGKLNSAIESLVKKDWNLYTTVKAPGINRNRNFGASF